MKRQKRYNTERYTPRSVCVQYATGEEQRNSSRRNEQAEPNQKQHTVVDVSGDKSKVQYYKKQYCIEIWNVRSMNQSKLEEVKQEMARVNMDILGISSVQFSYAVCLTLCDPMDCSTPGLPLNHHLLEPTKTHVH